MRAWERGGSIVREAEGRRDVECECRCWMLQRQGQRARDTGWRLSWQMAPAATPPACHFCSEGKLFGGHFGDPFSPLYNSLITGSAACNTSLPRQSPCLLWTSTDLPLAPVGSQCFTAASVPQAVMVAQPWSRHSNSESRVWRLGSVPASAAQPQRVHSMEAAEIVTPPPNHHSACQPLPHPAALDCLRVVLAPMLRLCRCAT